MAELLNEHENPAAKERGGAKKLGRARLAICGVVAVRMVLVTSANFLYLVRNFGGSP